MNKKTNAFATAADVGALAAAARAAEQYADKQPGTPAKRPQTVQCNFRIAEDARERLRTYAFVKGTTERDLIEAFCYALPEVAIPAVATPESCGFLK